MKALRSLAAGLSLVVAASAADAQPTYQIKFQNGPFTNPTGFGYYVGPFTGQNLSLPGNPTIDLYCMDVLNQVQAGVTWTAYITNLSWNLDNTRQGNAGLSKYQKAAWLTTQYTAANKATEWKFIQAAIWDILNPGLPNGGGQETFWKTKAEEWYASDAVEDFEFARFSIVTDVTGVGQLQGGKQEFLTYSTPEPGTWLLLGSGLLMMFAGVGARRFMA